MPPWRGRCNPAGTSSARKCARSRPSSPPGSAAPAAVGCGNGTDALALALRALGVGPGTSVVTVSHTAVATVAAIEMVGATPLLIDIEPDCYTMDPAELAAVLDHPPAGLPPIRAVIPVHLYGQPADARADHRDVPRGMACPSSRIARRRMAPRSAGARWARSPRSRPSAFIRPRTSGRSAMAAWWRRRSRNWPRDIAALRQYGWRTHYISDEVGVNSRLDEIQAAILRVKLAHLDAQNARRQRIAAAYDAALRGTTLAPPARRQGTAHVFHLYVLLDAGPRQHASRACADRASGPACIIPCPSIFSRRTGTASPLVHPAVAPRKSLPEQVLSLPIYPELTDAQVAQVCEALRRALTRARNRRFDARLFWHHRLVAARGAWRRDHRHGALCRWRHWRVDARIDRWRMQRAFLSDSRSLSVRRSRTARCRAGDLLRWRLRGAWRCDRRLRRPAVAQAADSAQAAMMARATANRPSKKLSSVMTPPGG